MAITLRTGSYGSYYGSLPGFSESIGDSAQLNINALYIFKYLKAKKWTLQAIAGLLGNMQHESALNPGRWQGEKVNNLSGGFGLIQWTGADIHLNWCKTNKYSDPTTMDANLAHIVAEAESNASWFYSTTADRYKYLETKGITGYKISYTEFTQSTDNPANLAAIFAWNRERSLDVLYGDQTARDTVVSDRGTSASVWYDYLLAYTTGATIDKVLSWAADIANDNRHGYDQTNRWGPDYDCSSLVISAWEQANIPVKSEHGATYTGNLVDAFKNAGFTDVTSLVTLSSGVGLAVGDVVWTAGHVEMVYSVTDTITLVGAHINENGEVTGGITGDQTNNEISIANYYNYPWTTVLRFSSSTYMPDPPVINSFISTDISTVTASFEIKITGDSLTSFTYSIIKINKKGEESEAGTGELPLISEQTFTVEGLVPDTDYRIKVTVTNSGGSTESETTFKTLQDYPDPVESINIAPINNKNLETSNFLASIVSPARWGYWKDVANNDYGYLVFFIANSKLLHSFYNSVADSLYLKPIDADITHGMNFQVGISSWVTDNDGEKVFALPGEIFPVGSNSIMLKDISEMSDTWFIISNNRINRVQPYITTDNSSTFKPIRLFKR